MKSSQSNNLQPGIESAYDEVSQFCLFFIYIHLLFGRLNELEATFSLSLSFTLFANNILHFVLSIGNKKIDLSMNQSIKRSMISWYIYKQTFRARVWWIFWSWWWINMLLSHYIHPLQTHSSHHHHHTPHTPPQTHWLSN